MLMSEPYPSFGPAPTRNFQIDPEPDRVPDPVAHLTVRARDGIALRVTRR